MSKAGCSRIGAALFSTLAVFWGCVQVARGDYTYGEPTKVPNVSMPGAHSAQISRDGLELYFSYGTPNECGDLWVARRSTTKEAWGTPVPLDPPVNSPGPAGGVCISADRLELYFGENHPVYWTAGCAPRPGGLGNGDLWVSKRATRADPWGNSENLGPAVNSARWDDHPSISADGLSLYFVSNRAAGGDLGNLFVTTRLTKNDPWGPAVPVGAPIASWGEASPFISADGLSLFYAAGGFTADIKVSRRATTTAPWDKPVPFTLVNSPGAEYHLSFSTEDSTLYFTRADNALAVFDLYQVRLLPIVDFNADGKVDLVDLVMLIDNWGSNKTLCDIGPYAWGDGKVDIEDLKVFMTYYEKENPPVKP
ncbi:MAG: hypothetical protein FJ280_21490 [Planctomycetes bacterium]|nr:hypothetical protein [Planctomycetota bacterium]